jgi:DNA glycosylase AlkZ-like
MSLMNSAAEVTPGQAMQWRLRQQHLVALAPDLVTTATRLCGVHAQVMSGAAQIVGVRTSSFTTPDLDDALWQQRTLVKTWGMRGTLHLFPAAELPLWVAAFKQRQWPRFTPAWEKYHGVKPDDLRRITAAVGDVLPGRVLTRDELATEIAAALRKPALAEKIRSGWGVMLKPAAAGGLLCFGPDRDRNVTFTDPRSHLPTVAWGMTSIRTTRCVKSWPVSSTPTVLRPTRTSAGGGGPTRPPLDASSLPTRTRRWASCRRTRRPG